MTLRLPLTIRDAQRMLSKSIRYTDYDEGYELAHEVFMATKVFGVRRCQAYLASLAAKNGADYIIKDVENSNSSGESRPKDTNEVAPQSNNPSEDSPLHGGDGSSGEVDNPQGGGDKTSDNEAVPRDKADPSAENTPNNDNPLDNSAERAETNSVTSANRSSMQEKVNGVAKTSSDEGDSNQTNIIMSVSGDAVAKLERLEKRHEKVHFDETDSSQDELTGRANEDEPSDARPDPQAKESGDNDRLSEKISYHYVSVKSKRSGSRSSNHLYGGVTATLKNGTSPKIIKQVRAAFSLLLDDGEAATGPRWDWGEFSKRLLTYRPLQPAKREEEGRPAILVLADVSGSCSGFSDRAVEVANAAAHLGVRGADVIVVAHSNGHPTELKINNDAPTTLPYGDVFSRIKTVGFYDSLIAKFNIKVSVVIGDGDAVWLYNHLINSLKLEKFIWLDNYACNYTSPTQKSITKTHYAKSLKIASTEQRKTKYVYGCKSAEDFVTALKIAMR